jgi:hypothetical protein
MLIDVHATFRVDWHVFPLWPESVERSTLVTLMVAFCCVVGSSRGGARRCPFGVTDGLANWARRIWCNSCVKGAAFDGNGQ